MYRLRHKETSTGRGNKLHGKMHCFTHIEVAMGVKIKNGSCLREKRTWKMGRRSEEKVKVSISAKKSCLMVV